MNPMTNVKNIKKLNEQELRRSLKTSWHDQYKDSAWIFVGGLPYDLTEGDIICVFSQYGEVVNINLVRDKDTGKQKGFCFLCYEDQRSTNLAVDNFNGMKLLGRTLRVDHVADYKAPKDSKKKDADTRRLLDEGCAMTTITPTNTTSGTMVENMIPNVKKEKEDDKNDCMIIEKETPVADVLKDVKSEFKSKKKRKDKVVPKVKVKKEKDSDKKKKRTKRRSSSSSSSDESSSSNSSTSESSTTSSSEDSDSDEKKARLKKHKHKLDWKKKTKNDGSAQHGTQSSASSKRRKLEEKIKALEKALNSVRSGKSKQK